MHILRIKEVFHNLLLSVISVIFLYFLIFGIFWFCISRTNLEYEKQEQEKDEKYKAELLIAAKRRKPLIGQKQSFFSG